MCLPWYFVSCFVSCVSRLPSYCTVEGLYLLEVLLYTCPNCFKKTTHLVKSLSLDGPERPSIRAGVNTRRVRLKSFALVCGKRDTTVCGTHFVIPCHDKYHSPPPPPMVKFPNWNELYLPVFRSRNYLFSAPATTLTIISAQAPAPASAIYVFAL